MSRTSVFRTQVEFGDCDPAQIVWFPNFFRWVDAASRHYFVSAGVPLWSELTRTRGIIGTPLLDCQASFKRTATYGDPIEVHTQVPDWGSKAFTMNHEIRSGDTLLATIVEKRAFVRKHPDDPARMQAIVVPDDIKALCAGA